MKRFSTLSWLMPATLTSSRIPAAPASISQRGQFAGVGSAATLARGLAATGSGHAAAAAREQAHQGHAVLHGQLLGVDALAQAGRRRRPALEREILAPYHAGPAVQARHAQHVVARREFDQASLVVDLGVTGHRALLGEAPLVDQHVNALAHREAALAVLTVNGLGAAHGQRGLAARPYPLGFLVPAHGLVLANPGRDERPRHLPTAFYRHRQPGAPVGSTVQTWAGSAHTPLQVGPPSDSQGSSGGSTHSHSASPALYSQTWAGLMHTPLQVGPASDSQGSSGGSTHSHSCSPAL